MKSSKLLEIAQTDPAQYQAIKARDSLTGMNATDIVKVYFREGLQCELTPHEANIAARWERAREMFLDTQPYSEIVSELKQEFGISEAQAGVDLRNATSLFGEVDKVSKEAHRLRAINMALKCYNEASNTKEKTNATKAYILAAGLDKEDIEVPNLEKIMKERIHAVVMEDSLRTMLMQYAAQSGSIDITTFFEKITQTATDAEYTPVSE